MAAFGLGWIAAALLQTDAPASTAQQPPVAQVLRCPRLDIHRNAVLHSWVTALAEGFPSVLKLVGEPFFRAMGAEAVRASPPRHPVLLAYGAEFPHFLERFPPVSGLPYLADVARLDGLRRRAWNAPDSAPLEPAGLAALSIEAAAELRIGLHPSAATLGSAYPARSIWLAQNGASEDINALHGSQHTLIWRCREHVRVLDLHAADRALHACLRALREAPRLEQLLSDPSLVVGFAEALALGLVVPADAADTDPLFDPFTTTGASTTGALP